jgi:phosphate transport system ATP-binding protein
MKVPGGLEVPVPQVRAEGSISVLDAKPALELRDVNIFYGRHRALRDVTLDLPEHEITALIGPSGCGKTSLLRGLNRMNDEIASARLEGQVLYRGDDIYAPGVDATAIRRAIGMVFQRANPFPKSIYENVAFAPRALRLKSLSLDDVVEQSLRRAGLWDEVRDKLSRNALGLSGGQQQRLCIARALAVEPDVLLMDEPCSALDPLATLRIESLLGELKHDYTIVIVTHNLQQAARVADRTAFFTAELNETRISTGLLVEYDATARIFGSPTDPRTDDYISGRFG